MSVIAEKKSRDRARRFITLVLSPDTTLAEVERMAGLAGALRRFRTMEPLEFMFLPDRARKCRLLYENDFEVITTTMTNRFLHRPTGRAYELGEAVMRAKLSAAPGEKGLIL